jgi:predicted transcriptional regulator
MEKIKIKIERRDGIANWILIIASIVMALITGFYIYCGNDPERLFNLLLPLISTWIGTLLAFYFGRENFEAASKSYDHLINKLTPEILDDILVKQIMIDKFTMVSLNVTNEMITTFDLKKLHDFLVGINKSRLPILEDDKIKYIIHKSTFSDELLKTTPATTLNTFITNNPKIKEVETINENKKVEEARKLMNDKNCKDLFIVNDKNEVVGWITDTQILRYIDNQKI